MCDDYDPYDTNKATTPTRIPIPPMTSEELGKLEEKLIAWRTHYTTRETESRNLSPAFPRYSLQRYFRGKAEGLNEALEMLRGNQGSAQWPPSNFARSAPDV